MATTPSTLQPLITEAFLSLANLLDRQPAEAWDTQSLCDAWRTREVVAHMTTAARYEPDEFMAELAADGGDTGRTIDRIAERDGQLSPDTLIANLRDERLHRWIPPGGGEHGALSHVVIHSLDVTLPLGIRLPLPEETLRIVLDHLTSGGAHAHFGIELDTVQLRATDLDWTHGEGRTVTGPATDLALALCGRQLAPGRISGVIG